MQIIFNALIIFATIDLALFAYEQIRKIYGRYQDQKSTEIFFNWVKKNSDHEKEEPHE
jgi:hypothetical protein